MSAVLVFALRIILSMALYTFLGWSLYAIWKEISLHSQLIRMRRFPKIALFHTDGGEKHLEFTQKEILIGRDPACDVVLESDTVSNRHARISFHHKQWWLEDIQSTNGTFINEERISSPSVIFSGDEIRCGFEQLQITFIED